MPSVREGDRLTDGRRRGIVDRIAVEATSTFHIHQVRRRANWDPGLDP